MRRKEEVIMWKRIYKFENVLASLALMFSVVAANQACNFFAHQPELPENVKKLRKF